MPAQDGLDPHAPKPYDKVARSRTAKNLKTNLPLTLRQLQAFVVFKFAPPRKPGGKRAKLPFYVVTGKVRSGQHDTKQDRTHLVTFDKALELYQSDVKWAGVGVCALKSNDCFFIDLDNCFEPSTGGLNSIAAELLAWSTYTEFSPSGRGLRMVMLGNPQINRKAPQQGIELFCSTGFVTLTGLVFGKKLHRAKRITTTQVARLRELLSLEEVNPLDTTPSDAPASLLNLPNQLDKARYKDARKAIRHIDPDCDYPQWLQVGQALHSGDSSDIGKGFELWLSWSRRGDKFDYTSEEDMLRKWRGFKAGRGVTLNTLFHMAQQGGYNMPELEMPDDEVKSGGGLTWFESPGDKEEKKPVRLAENLFDNYGSYYLIGKAKIGKSRILGGMVAAALTGTSFLGFKFNKKCKVLALALEEDVDELYRRVRLYMVEPNDHKTSLAVVSDTKVKEWAKAKSEDYTWNVWFDALLKRVKPDFVYIDTPVKLRMVWQNSPEPTSRNITEQDYNAAMLFDDIARKYKCYIVTVIHASKRKNTPQGSYDPFESIGTTSWTLGGCTGALVVSHKQNFNSMEEPDEGERVFSVQGRYNKLGDRHYELTQNKNGAFRNMGDYLWLQVTKRTVEYLTVIWDIQNETGGQWVTARTVSGITGKGEGTIKRLLKRFADSGEIFQERRLISSTSHGYKLETVSAKRGKQTTADDEIFN